jgi:anti-sigma factor RsiW
MAQSELTCKELVEIITAYLEGALPPGERERFDQHLGTCRGCRNYLDQMRQTIKLAGTLSEDRIDPEAKRELLDIFRDWKKGRDNMESDHAGE